MISTDSNSMTDELQLREERKADLERHLQEVNALLPLKLLAEEGDDNEEKSNDDDSQQDYWNGLADPEPVPIDHEDEYIDEDKYTTVTVEEVDVSRSGLAKLRESDEEEEEAANGAVNTKNEPAKSSTNSKTHKAGTTGLKEKSGKTKKRKKRDFRYENKADRKLNHLKVQAKKSKLAKARRNG